MSAKSEELPRFPVFAFKNPASVILDVQKRHGGFGPMFVVQAQGTEGSLLRAVQTEPGDCGVLPAQVSGSAWPTVTEPFRL